MVERLGDMPAGTIGFRATGELTRADYEERFLPAIEAVIESGEGRMLYAIGPGFEGIEPGALAEDAKAELKALRHHEAWKRTAVATDVGWIRDALRLFAWMVPGDVKVFELDDLAAAKSWLAA
jgi:hypothetical protein